MRAAILPGSLDGGGRPAMLGVMGGGQLGRMFVHAAQSMGYRTAVLDPDAASPAGLVSHLHVATPYLDAEGLARLAREAAAITTEFENVPAPAMAALAAERPVSPGAEALAVCQDRAAEKAFFGRCGVPCAPYALIDGETAAGSAAPALFPGILKTCRLGYDGLGQVPVADASGLAGAWARLGRVPCVLERRLDLALEVSVIVARGSEGGIVHFPVQQNVHRGGILAVTRSAAPDLPPAGAAEAVAAAGAIAEALDYVGVLCVEFFVLADGRLVANEMAPRPHNSGHYTIDACDLSQFDLQVRTTAGLPLVAPRLHSAAVMLNLLGELWLQGAPAWDRVLALPGAHLHLYGKLQPRQGRKMGHLTLTAASAAEALARARAAAALLGLPPPA